MKNEFNFVVQAAQGCIYLWEVSKFGMKCRTDEIIYVNEQSMNFFDKFYIVPSSPSHLFHLKNGYIAVFLPGKWLIAVPPLPPTESWLHSGISPFYSQITLEEILLYSRFPLFLRFGYGGPVVAIICNI